jgi:hypothetical protein
MAIPEHKQYQQLYQQLVTEHTDDFSKMEYVVAPEIVQNALYYFKGQNFPLIYPAKSYAVAVIYAYLLFKEYGIPIRDSLSDKDLFLGQDEYFVPYHEDVASYEAILKELNYTHNWITLGWAPKTAEYFRLECTAAGIQEVMERLNG